MTTQVPAVSAITFGQASHSSVRRIGPSSSAFFTGASGGGSGRSSSSTGISATPISDISAPARGLGAAARCFLARRGVIPRAQGAMGACGIAGGPLISGAGFHGEFMPRRTNVRAGTALLRRDPSRNPAMRKNILLAIVRRRTGAAACRL